jgi:hypothetical protein
VDEDLSRPENYVYALGFRNPFGITNVGDRLFVAENGRAIDRFTEIFPGTDYFWNGEDISIGTLAIANFYPAIGPGQLDYLPAGTGLFPTEDEGAFYIGETGSFRGIIKVKIDLDTNEVIEAPQELLTFIGEPLSYNGIVPGVAVGPDGLYFASMMPNRGASASIFRITYDPVNEHPYRGDMLTNPVSLIAHYGCLGCHSMGGGGGTQAPNLDYEDLFPRLRNRLSSDVYQAYLNTVDELTEAPFPEYTEARQQLRDLRGTGAITRVWLFYHLLEPKFDNPVATMPNLGLTPDQAEIIAEYLLKKPVEAQSNVADGEESNEPLVEELPEEDTDFAADVEEHTFYERVKASILEVLPPPRFRQMPFVLLLGFLLGVVVMWLREKRKQ